QAGRADVASPVFDVHQRSSYGRLPPSVLRALPCRGAMSSSLPSGGLHMSSISSKKSAVAVTALAVILGTTIWVRSQDAEPQDSTPGVALLEQDPDAKDTGADQDDATARLAWQRGAWGVVTAAFRANAIKEGRDHSNK